MLSESDMQITPLTAVF